MSTTIPPIVVMGVQGAGKSTIGTLLAERLGIQFIDGDRLHSAENVAKMSAGIALTDVERLPWLREIGGVLRDHRDSGIVVVCSALKREYRDLMREFVPDLFVVDPEGPIELVAARINERQHEYMPPELLQSQYDTLVPLQDDESGVIVDIHFAPAELIDAIVEAVERSSATEGSAHAH